MSGPDMLQCERRLSGALRPLSIHAALPETAFLAIPLTFGESQKDNPGARREFRPPFPVTVEALYTALTILVAESPPALLKFFRVNFPSRIAFFEDVHRRFFRPVGL